MKSVRHIAIAFVAFLVTAAAAQAETIDNPRYVSWAKYQPGTKITLQNDMAGTGISTSQHIEQTLAEVTPDKAVVDVVMTVDMGGQKREIKRKQDVAAKVEKGNENLPPEVKGSAKETGKETIEVAGKSYECTIVEIEGQTERGKVNGKVWRTPEIPGGTAKMEMAIDAGGMQVTTTTKVTAIAIK